MKALITRRHGGPEVLEVQERPDLTAGKGQVRIAVSRAGVNFADIAARVGLYPDAPKPPMVVGYEVAGTVDQVGERVTGLAKGTRVSAITHFGGQATQVLVDARFARPLPEGMTEDLAAALPVNYMTAYHMLFRVGHLRPRAKVLVHMAAGGVGLAAIELCKTVPGIEIFGTASAGKHAMLREAGVQHPIDYRTQDYVEEVRRATNGRGVDLVLDALGGKDWEKGYSILAPAGQLIIFGWANMISGTKRSIPTVLGQLLAMPRFSPMKLMPDNRGVAGVNLGHLWTEPDMMGEELDALLALFREGKIHPHVDRVFPLSQAAEAHRYIQDRKNVGKVLLDCTA
jgi:NADPH:quinone reductase-like Zn-dependent oxidoreductase